MTMRFQLMEWRTFSRSFGSRRIFLWCKGPPRNCHECRKVLARMIQFFDIRTKKNSSNREKTNWASINIGFFPLCPRVWWFLFDVFFFLQQSMVGGPYKTVAEINFYFSAQTNERKRMKLTKFSALSVNKRGGILWIIIIIMLFLYSFHNCSAMNVHRSGRNNRDSTNKPCNARNGVRPLPGV